MLTPSAKPRQPRAPPAEFDKFADEYRSLHSANIRASGEEPEYFAEYKVRDVAESRRRSKAAVRKILDIGSGIGASVPYFRAHFRDASLTCVDVSERSLEIASERFRQDAEFELFDGVNLPFEPDTFDVVFAACVLHHVEPANHLALLREASRVVTDTGVLALFEHNPLNPLTVRAVSTCPFDENATLIAPWTMAARVRSAGFSTLDLRFRIFFPNALRRLRPLERVLKWCPLGAQYSIFATR